jgi:hypothetical protein
MLGAPSGIYTVTTYIYERAVTYVPPRYEVANADPPPSLLSGC